MGHKPPEDTSSTIPTQPWHAQAKLRIIRRVYMYAKPKWGMSNELWRYEPSYTPYGCGESTSTSPKSPHEDTSSTIPTQPWHAQAKLRIIRRVLSRTHRLSYDWDPMPLYKITLCFMYACFLRLYHVNAYILEYCYPCYHYPYILSYPRIPNVACYFKRSISPRLYELRG